MQTTTIIQPTHTPHPLFTDIRDIDPGLLMLAVSLMNIDTVHNSARNSLFRDEHLIGTLGKVAPLGGKISAAKNRIIQQELQATNGELSTLSKLTSRYVDNATVNETDNQRFSEQKDWAASARILFPNNEGRGAHVNISGMSLAKHAPNRENAIKLMEFLSSDKAQQIYGSANFEYPVKPGVEPDELTKSWGDLNPDKLPLDVLATHRDLASKMVDKIGFESGPDS